MGSTRWLSKCRHVVLGRSKKSQSFHQLPGGKTDPEVPVAVAASLAFGLEVLANRHVQNPSRVEMLDKCGHDLIGNHIGVDLNLEFLCR